MRRSRPRAAHALPPDRAQPWRRRIGQSPRGRRPPTARPLALHHARVVR